MHANLERLSLPYVMRACLSKVSLFAPWPYVEHPETTLSLCFVLSLVIHFHFVVVDLECDVSTFSYASLLELKMFKMYYRGDVVVQSMTKSCCALCILIFFFCLQLTVFNVLFNEVFNVFLFHLSFIKLIYLKT